METDPNVQMYRFDIRKFTPEKHPKSTPKPSCSRRFSGRFALGGDGYRNVSQQFTTTVPSYRLTVFCVPFCSLRANKHLFVSEDASFFVASRSLSLKDSRLFLCSCVAKKPHLRQTKTTSFGQRATPSCPTIWYSHLRPKRKNRKELTTKTQEWGCGDPQACLLNKIIESSELRRIVPWAKNASPAIMQSEGIVHESPVFCNMIFLASSQLIDSQNRTFWGNVHTAKTDEFICIIGSGGFRVRKGRG